MDLSIAHVRQFGGAPRYRAREIAHARTRPRPKINSTYVTTATYMENTTYFRSTPTHFGSTPHPLRNCHEALPKCQDPVRNCQDPVPKHPHPLPNCHEALPKCQDPVRNCQDPVPRHPHPLTASRRRAPAALSDHGVCDSREVEGSWDDGGKGGQHRRCAISVAGRSR